MRTLFSLALVVGIALFASSCAKSIGEMVEAHGPAKSNQGRLIVYRPADGIRIAMTVFIDDWAAQHSIPSGSGEFIYLSPGRSYTLTFGSGWDIKYQVALAPGETRYLRLKVSKESLFTLIPTVALEDVDEKTGIAESHGVVWVGQASRN